MFKAVREHKILLSIIALIAGIVIGLVIAGRPNLSKNGEAKPRIGKISGEIDIRNAFINVAETIGPAVVSIYTERTHKVGARRFQFGPQGSPFRDKFFDDFFKEFFRDTPEREYRQTGMGSGVIIDEQGYILTNEHVIRGADKITVALTDGREFEGTIKGTDPRSDLAVVKINSKDLPVAELGDSDLVQIGEWAVAIGNPFGFIMRSSEPTVTAGVISALHRSLPKRLPGYTDLIQTDAAINPGNSGGPLCDLNGNVIGINVAIFTQSGGYQGVSFAIPINYAKNILDDLLKGKKVLHGWLGVSVQELTDDLADYFGIEARAGVLIADLVEDGPAEEAGLEEGDVIVGFDGKKIKNVNELLRSINQARVGKKVKVGAVRSKRPITLSVVIGERPTEIDKDIIGEPEEKKGPEEKKEVKWRGAVIISITDIIASQLGLKDKDGVVVVHVEPNTPASLAGLRKGDVIRELNRREIDGIDDFKKGIKSPEGDALIHTLRGYLVVKEK